METMAASTEIMGCSSMIKMVFSQFMEVTMGDQILDENKGKATLADGAMFELTDWRQLQVGPTHFVKIMIKAVGNASKC